MVRGVRDRGQSPALLGAVAAGIPAFGQELGEAAEGVWRRCSGGQTHRHRGRPIWHRLVTHYRNRTGREPSYPAAQAAAAGYLAHAAHRQDLGFNDLPQWTTSTFFGDFILDPAWHQGRSSHHDHPLAEGRMVPIVVDAASGASHL